MVLEIASLKKKKKKKKKKERRWRFSIFSKFVFSASIKLSGNQRTYLYSGGSGLSIDIHFVDIELSYDVLSPLPTLLSKHFNHPHPYIEIATAISEIATAISDNTGSKCLVTDIFSPWLTQLTATCTQQIGHTSTHTHTHTHTHTTYYCNNCHCTSHFSAICFVGLHVRSKTSYEQREENKFKDDGWMNLTLSLL